MQAGRRFTMTVTLLGSLLLAGCKNRELVENELRARDIQYREALEELGRSEARADALEREVGALRQGGKITPEQAAQMFGLKRIVLGRLTGGYDNDGLPGDEALQVVIEPHDAAEHSIKTPGQVQITALEINFQGVKIPIGEWHIGADQLRQSWKQGLLSTGYVLILPWKTFPRSENVRVVARLILPDGRVYEADRDVKVRVVPGAGSRPCDLPEMPPSDAGPTFVPALKQPYPNQPAGQWSPAPLDNAVQLGRPVPQLSHQAVLPADE
jgi:outer membrane murein-binding lipoprotein Lpp